MKNLLMVVAIVLIGTSLLVGGIAGLDLAIASVDFLDDPKEDIATAAGLGMLGFILFTWLLLEAKQETYHGRSNSHTNRNGNRERAVRH
jgi:hypothetical protein